MVKASDYNNLDQIERRIRNCRTAIEQNLDDADRKIDKAERQLQRERRKYAQRPQLFEDAASRAEAEALFERLEALIAKRRAEVKSWRWGQ